MRLLKTECSNTHHWRPQLVDSRGEQYAILSHCWRRNPHEEVLFSDIELIDDGGLDVNTGRRKSDFVKNRVYANTLPRDKPGYQKLWNAARWALSNGYAFLWADTCCIDTSNNAEVSEAINSMWTWYSKSLVCYAYLEDIPSEYCDVQNLTKASIEYSQWWKRGWTLPELIAPPEVVFFTQQWQVIGYRTRLSDVISVITGIDPEILTNTRGPESVSIARRMSWASRRRTSRIEDVAYSLMGIFSVNMPILYGEGEKAFLRLQQEIIRDSDDESIFAWVYPAAHPDHHSGLLARHPSAFAGSGDIGPFNTDSEDREPYAMTNRGLGIKLHVSPVQDGSYVAALHCPALRGRDGFLAIYLERVSNESQQYVRIRCDRLTAVSKRGTGRRIYIRQIAQMQRTDPVRPRSHVYRGSEQHTVGSPSVLSAQETMYTAHERLSTSELSQLEAVEPKSSEKASATKDAVPRKKLWQKLGRGN